MTLVAGAVAVWALGGPVAEAVGLGDGPTTPRRVHVVRPGETLWSIAESLEPRTDPRQVVFRIREANDLEPASLVPGQELVVPVVD